MRQHGASPGFLGSKQQKRELFASRGELYIFRNRRTQLIVSASFPPTHLLLHRIHRLEFAHPPPSHHHACWTFMKALSTLFAPGSLLHLVLSLLFFVTPFANARLASLCKSPVPRFGVSANGLSYRLVFGHVLLSTGISSHSRIPRSILST